VTRSHHDIAEEFKLVVKQKSLSHSTLNQLACNHYSGIKLDKNYQRVEKNNHLITLLKESLDSDGQQFTQYQQNE
jgi:hypothetical protein